MARLRCGRHARARRRTAAASRSRPRKQRASTARRTPRSSAGHTSGRPSARARNHSADQRPSPRTAVSRAIDRLVGRPGQRPEIELPRGQFPREPDDVLGLALRELHRPELGDRRVGQHGRGGERVDGDALELHRRPVPPDQARARREGEGEVHLLGADRADQHLERVGHEGRAQAEEPARRADERREHRVGRRGRVEARKIPALAEEVRGVPPERGPHRRRVRAREGEGRAGPGRRPGDGEPERHQPVPHARHPVERAVAVGARRVDAPAPVPRERQQGVERRLRSEREKSPSVP